MDRTASAIRLQTQHRFNTFGLPFVIIAMAFVVVLLIGVVANVGAGGDPEALDGMYEGMRWNGAIFSLLGPLMGLGFTAMLQMFPLALGLGITRREFGTASVAVFGGMSLLFATVVTVLREIEIATSGWWMRIRVFDVAYVGGGDWWQTLLHTFVLLLMAMLLSAAFSTVYLRGGQTMLWLVLAGITLLSVLAAGIGMVVVPGGFLAIAETVFAASWIAWVVGFAVVAAPWLAWVAGFAIVGAVAALAWGLLIRRAPVR